MCDVAERVLLRLEPAVGGHVDAPVYDILARVVARRQAQGLDHARTWSIVAVHGFVRDTDAHGLFLRLPPPYPPPLAGEGREGGSLLQILGIYRCPERTVVGNEF